MNFSDLIQQIHFNTSLDPGAEHHNFVYPLPQQDPLVDAQLQTSQSLTAKSVVVAEAKVHTAVAKQRHQKQSVELQLQDLREKLEQELHRNEQKQQKEMALSQRASEKQQTQQQPESINKSVSATAEAQNFLAQQEEIERLKRENQSLKAEVDTVKTQAVTQRLQKNFTRDQAFEVRAQLAEEQRDLKEALLRKSYEGLQAILYIVEATVQKGFPAVHKCKSRCKFCYDENGTRRCTAEVKEVEHMVVDEERALAAQFQRVLTAVFKEPETALEQAPLLTQLAGNIRIKREHIQKLQNLTKHK